MEAGTKKSWRMHLMEIFFRQSFIDEPNKRDALKACFMHDMQWFLGSVIFIETAVLIVLLFG